MRGNRGDRGDQRTDSKLQWNLFLGLPGFIGLPSLYKRSTLSSDLPLSLPAPRQHLGIHVVIASAVFLGVTALSNGPLKATILEWQTEGRGAIAAEHKGSASLGLDVSTLQGTAIIDCVNEGEGTIYLSLPESWKRREVRNARLEDVTLVETGLGFTRWTLPAGATLSMTVPEAPRHMTLHHPSPGLLKVRLSRIDLEDDAVTRDTILVQGKEVEIW